MHLSSLRSSACSLLHSSLAFCALSNRPLMVIFTYWVVIIASTGKQKDSRQTLQTLREASNGCGQDILLGTLNTLDEDNIMG